MIAEGLARDGTDWIRETSNGPDRRIPLYEAKMVHHFDHRWATYDRDSVDEEGARDSTLIEKQSPDFEPSPRYWVPEWEVKLRAARVPSSLKRGIRETNPKRIQKSLVEWLSGAFITLEGRALSEGDMTSILGRDCSWRVVLGVSPDRFLREAKTLANGAEMQLETPLDQNDIAFLRECRGDPLANGIALVNRMQPRWLMGWRDICRSTDERTLIASVFPPAGAGDKILIIHPRKAISEAVALISLLSSLVLDYACRQKFGGTSLKYYYLKQLPVPSPSVFTREDIAFITPRILELTYTSYSMRLWAEDLGHYGPPFEWNEDRRATLRAELDAIIAIKFGLDLDGLRYVLDPTNVKGSEYPSETFRVLKAKETARLGEYRTGRLVLDAWARLATTSVGTRPIEVRVESATARVLRDGAWARPIPAGAGDAGAMLAAILKAMDGPLPARQVRLAATFGLEPRLLLPHLDPNQAVEWHRLIGAEAAPLTGNAASFAPRVDRTWGSAVTAHRGNGRLVENLTAGTWAPGSGLDAIDTAGWPDGRAGMLMRVLPHIATDAVISAMPAEIRGWIDAAAA
jgi:hypothetical protein